MLLEIHYPLMQGARIKGSIRLDSHEIKGMERHKLIQALFLKMAEKLSDSTTKAATASKQEKPEVGGNKAIAGSGMPASIAAVHGPRQNFKRSLVCPGLKTRRVHGAQFKNVVLDLGSDEEEK